MKHPDILGIQKMIISDFLEEFWKKIILLGKKNQLIYFWKIQSSPEILLLRKAFVKYQFYLFF